MAALECQTCHRDTISHWKIINAVVIVINAPLYSAILGKEKPQGEARINCSGSAFLTDPPLTLNV